MSAALANLFKSLFICWVSVLIGVIGKILSCVFGFKNLGGDLFLKVLPPLLQRLLKPRIFLPGFSVSILRRLGCSLPK